MHVRFTAGRNHWHYCHLGGRLPAYRKPSNQPCKRQIFSSIPGLATGHLRLNSQHGDCNTLVHPQARGVNAQVIPTRIQPALAGKGTHISIPVAVVLRDQLFGIPASRQNNFCTRWIRLAKPACTRMLNWHG